MDEFQLFTKHPTWLKSVKEFSFDAKMRDGPERMLLSNLLTLDSADGCKHHLFTS